jgi:hypothetical protein
MSWWMQPSGIHITLAMEQLGLDDDDLEVVAEWDSRYIRVGRYPTLDRVYDLAHELAAKDLNGSIAESR